jgi:hypothetical protein
MPRSGIRLLGATARAVLLALAAAAPGCREYPPVIAPDYIGSPTAPGWPPLAVYDVDPFHPRNRWFHRAFGTRTAAGDIVPPHADEPFALLAAPSRVDAAELGALLEAALATALLDTAPVDPTRVAPRERVADAIFRADALAEASRLQASLPADDPAEAVLVPLLLRLAAGSAERLAGEGGLAHELEPPPLREGAWVEAPVPAAPGLAPSPFDPRWTLALRREAAPGGRARVALLRLRSGLDARRAPVLLPLASECWEIEEGGEDGAAAVWRFDRAEWLAGRDPWRRVPERSEITIRDPADPARLITGEVKPLCAGCHENGIARREPPAAAVPQIQAVTGALQGVLGSGAGP